MESVLPAIGLTPTVGGVMTGIKYANLVGKKSYDAVKFITGGRTGVRELSEGVVKKGLTGSAVSSLVGSNKMVIGSAKKLPENKDSMVKKGVKRSAKSYPGNQATKKFKSKAKTTAMVQKKLAKRKSTMGKTPSGSYRGRFKKPKKLVKDIKSKAGKLGWTVVQEVAGQVIDSDCVYIHHTNYQQDEISKAVTGGVIRALFREANIAISNDEQELPLCASDASALGQSWSIVYVVQDPISHAQFSTTYGIPDNSTLRSVISACTTLANHIGNHAAAYMSNGNFRVPYMVCLYQAYTGGNYLHTSLLMENLKVRYEVSSTLTVQNSTLGSGATTDGGADRVDNQPLKGSLYQFKNADPRLKQTQSSNTNVLSNYDVLFSSGIAGAVPVRTWGADVMPYTIDDEPPTPRMWKNIKKSSGVTLEPGHIKKAVLVNRYVNYYPELLKKFRGDVNGATLGLSLLNNVSGCQSQILALEERVRTPSTNKITVNWEVELRNYCIVEHRRKDCYTRGVFHSTSSIPQWVPPT